MYSRGTGTDFRCVCMLWKTGEAHGILGVKRTKNGISEYGEHAADDVSVGCSRISGEKKEYHWRDRTQRHGQFLSVCYTAV